MGHRLTVSLSFAAHSRAVDLVFARRQHGPSISVFARSFGARGGWRGARERVRLRVRNACDLRVGRKRPEVRFRGRNQIAVPFSGVASEIPIFDLRTRRYSMLRVRGGYLAWLRDSKHLLIGRPGFMEIANTATQASHPVVSLDFDELYLVPRQENSVVVSAELPKYCVEFGSRRPSSGCVGAIRLCEPLFICDRHVIQRAIDLHTIELRKRMTGPCGMVRARHNAAKNVRKTIIASPESGKQVMDVLEDAREFDSSQVERDITALIPIAKF